MADLLSVTIGGKPTGPDAPVVAAPVVVAPPVVTAPQPGVLNPVNPPVIKAEARPAWLPDKFKDAEQMALAYSELEKKQSAGNPPPAVVTPPVVAETDPVKIAAAAAAKAAADAAAPADVLAKAGLNMADFVTEYGDKGALSPESYAKLATAGFPKDLVDAHVQGQLALAEKNNAPLFAIAGGQDGYKAAVAWAAANLSDAEKTAYNASVNGSVEQGKLAVTGLMARYNDANGQDPKLVQGHTATSTDSYRSRAEQQAAMKDPRYAKDPAYRDDVLQKSLRSTF